MSDAGGVAADRGASGSRGVDDVAVGALRAALGLPGVIRAGLALSVIGGRQLRFLPSDRHRLDAADWCLIDAFDRLPLNDAIRTGRPVSVASREALALHYPELADVQSSASTRSLVALPLGENGSRLGGLLMYADHEAPGPTEAQLALAAALTAGLTALRSSDTTAEGSLPADATAPGLARRLLRDTVASSSLDPDLLDAALLCVSELVTNVVMHAGRTPSMDVVLTDDALTVQVHHDASHAPPASHPADEDPLRISGRGLELVDALANAWGSESTSAGTTTWFRLDR